MTFLLLDVGNARVKWATLAGGGLGGHGERAHQGEGMARALAAVSCPGQPRAVWVANVAGAPAAAAVTAAMRGRYGLEPVFARVEPARCGVVIAYREPQRLGVDRWLAMIGARRGWSGPLCVADAGSALTVDALDGGGRHLGGLIAPGVEMMVRAVLSDTADVARFAVAPPGEGELFADDTAPAVAAGARHSAAALVERAARELERRCVTPCTVLLTGGGAPLLQRLIERQTEAVADLVLRGLAVVVRAQSEVPGDGEA